MNCRARWYPRAALGPSPVSANQALAFSNGRTGSRGLSARSSGQVIFYSHLPKGNLLHYGPLDHTGKRNLSVADR
jgi:hypothetical protein